MHHSVNHRVLSMKVMGSNSLPLYSVVSHTNLVVWNGEWVLFASTKFDIMEAILEQLKNDCLGILICSGAIEIIATGQGRPD